MKTIIIYITDVDALINELRYLSRTLLDHKEINTEKQVYTCLNCLNVFNSKYLLNKHYKLCQKNEAQTIEMPKPGDALKFSKFEARTKAPLIGAFDFESKMCKKDLHSTLTSKDLSSHKIISYSFMIITSESDIVFERTEADENNCLQLFMEAVFEASAQIRHILNKTTPMDLTPLENREFEDAKECHICGLDLYDLKVRDHCHFTGRYIGAAHQMCNI